MELKLALLIVGSSLVAVNAAIPSEPFANGDLPAWDCPVRELALEYANITLGGGKLQTVYDALNLSVCNTARPSARTGRSLKSHRLTDVAVASVYVAVDGNDNTGDGTERKPFATLHRAQISARSVLAKGSSAVSVVIKGGEYFLNATLELTEEDSGSSYMADPNSEDEVVISGGIQLSGLQWEKSSLSNATVYVADLPNGFNLQVTSIDELYYGDARQWPARYPNGDPSVPSDGYTMDGVPVADGKKEADALPLNVAVYCVDEPGGTPRSAAVAGGTMYPFDQQFNFTVPCSTIPQTPEENSGLGYGPLYSPPMYQGESLDRFVNNMSYWKSTVPGGLSRVFRAQGWKTDPTKWRVHAYHPESWGNWGFEVGDYDATTNQMMFARGGNQEARGGGNRIGAKYFSGILEELDSDNEFYFDSEGNKLYWSPANGLVPTSTTKIVVPKLAQLVSVTSSDNMKPVTNISLDGLVFKHSAPTFCCNYPYESVSGGDWSIHRGGMLFFENVSRSEVVDCVLDSPGGNGIFLNGHTSMMSIHHNEVKNAGDSLIVAVGYTAQMDGRASTFPYQNDISYNHLHNWGVWGKQTSAFFAGMSRELIFDHNIVYNGPRAGINQNDGFGGGNVFQYNLIFNTVLETGDHGNFNSWDRKPWIWLKDPMDHTSTEMVPQQHHIKHNFVVRTSYLGPSNNLYCLDHDDGSSMYNDTANFLVYGGVKFREGLSKHASGNYMVYPNGDDKREVPFADQVHGTNNSFLHNTVISATGQFYGACAGYSTTAPDYHVYIDYNIFYSPGRNFSDGGCAGDKGGAIKSFAKWQSSGLGQDQRSTLSDITEVAVSDILSAARSLVFPNKV